MNFKRSDNVNTAIIKIITTALCIAIVAAIVVLAVFAFVYEGEFVSALSLRIKPTPRFIVTTVLVLFFSSVLYTPFSYGISMYFLKSKTTKSTILTCFYLFKNKRLLVKAILVDTLRRVITTFLRACVLVIAVVLELLLLGLFKDVTRSVFVSVTVVMWCFVIVTFFIIKLKFILCKYALIANPQAKVVDCIKIGTRAINKKIVVTLRFYLKYLAIYIFMFFTIGFSRARRINRSRDSFCTYAVGLVSKY